MDTWFEEMEFSLDKVLEACSKTTGIANPNINYVNKVLVNWYEERTGKDKSGKRKELTCKDCKHCFKCIEWSRLYPCREFALYKPGNRETERFHNEKNNNRNSRQ